MNNTQIKPYLLCTFCVKKLQKVWKLLINSLSLQRIYIKDLIMDVKKVTYDEALARFKRSLEIKRAAEKRIAEEWARRGLKGTIVSL